MVEVDLLKRRARAAQYVPILAPWHVVEGPRGCLAELPAVLTYLVSYVRTNDQSGVWVTYYSEWCRR